MVARQSQSHSNQNGQEWCQNEIAKRSDSPETPLLLIYMCWPDRFDGIKQWNDEEH
jgi:hypothetical protein